MDTSRYDMAVGERASHIRKILGMRMEDVAGHVGVTRQSLGNYESGKTPMRASVIRRLCELYGCSPVWMLGMTDTLSMKCESNGRLIELREESPSIPLDGQDTV